MKALVAAVALVGVASVAGPIWVAVRTAEETVTPAPYATGLHFDRDRHLREALGWEVAVAEAGLHAGDCALAVTVAGRDRSPLGGAAVSVTVGRPGPDGSDRTYPAAPDGEGRWLARVRFPGYGHWDLRVTVSRGRDSATYEKHVYVRR
jgi:nitrogen fixation protein FixH